MPECQTLHITNDSLTWSGTGCFIAVPVWHFVNNGLPVEHSFTPHHNSTTGGQLFNTLQCYYVTGEWKCHNLCSKCPPFSLTQAWSRIRHCLMTESRHSVAVTLYRISGELYLVYVWEIVYCLKFQRTHNTTAQDIIFARMTSILANRISWAPGISLAVNSLQLKPVKCDVIITSSAGMNT